MRLSKARKEFVTAMMKDTIFEAAGSVLEEHGVNGITMDRVAATAGLAKGSLYNYFQDKDKLVRFLYAQLVEPFYQVIEEIADGDLPAPRKLEEILRVTVERSVKGKGIIRLLLETPQEHQEVKKGLRPRLIRLLTAIFQRGILDGAFRPHNPAHAARMFSGCLSELFEMCASDASTEEVKEYVGSLVDALHRGFFIPAETRRKSDKASPSSSNP